MIAHIRPLFRSRTVLLGLHLVREMTRDRVIRRETIQGENRWCARAIGRLTDSV